jgi:hypothetical protein
MQTPTLLLTALLSFTAATSALATEGEGLTTAPRWQGRILLGNAAPALDKWTAANGGSTVRSLSVLGDYYFGSRLNNRAALGTPSETRGGGFRATSGLLLGQRSGAYPLLNVGGSGRKFNVDLRSETLPLTEPAAAESNAVPYLGLGYTGSSIKGGWGFSADVGVMALNPGSAVKLGRVVGGGQSLDDVLREMRVSPVLQLGVSYSF